MAEEAAVVLVAILAKRLRKRRLSKRKHRFWVRKWLQNREKLGAYHQLLQELRSLDTSSYRNFSLGTGVPKLCAGFGTSSSASLAYS